MREKREYEKSTLLFVTSRNIQTICVTTQNRTITSAKEVELQSKPCQYSIKNEQSFPYFRAYKKNSLSQIKSTTTQTSQTIHKYHQHNPFTMK